MSRVPSSHGSLHEEGRQREEEEGERGAGRRSRLDPDSDDFNSDEFRAFLRQRREAGTSSRAKKRSSYEKDSDDDKNAGGKGGNTQPPEWDGIGIPFQDWLIKTKLWLTTCRARPQAQGPMILQRLSGAPFQAFKHWAKDTDWLSSRDGGLQLLEAMDKPEYFGDDKEEDMIGSLAKLTYHLKRNRDEKHREFFNRWDEALRKTKEHGIDLPDRYLGFLMINALGLDETTIKNLLSYTRGSIATKDVKEWTRKFETKLLAKDIGQEPKKTVGQSAVQKGTQAVYNLAAEATDFAEDEDEIHQVEAALEELHDGDGQTAVDDEDQSELVLDEHEAAEVLNTMLQQKRKTFSQSWKLKKAKEVARGYGDWKGKGSQGKGKTKGKGLSIDELKSMTRCRNCGRVGHWHRECTEPKREKNAKEINFLEPEEFDEASFCGWMEINDEDMDCIEKPDKEDNLEKVEKERYETETPNVDALEKQTAFCLRSSSESEVRRSASFERVDQDSKPVFSEPEAIRSYKDPIWSFTDRSETPEHEILWHDDGRPRRTWREPTPPIDELCCATIDTGCQRMAVGQTTLDLLSQALPKEVAVGKLQQSHRFRSVHGKSETTHIATVPTSLGHKGAVLRPAIFSQPESRNAPFLISLPFLLYCRAVLHLDPEDGLRIYFRKFKCSVKCHIGPTGALRVPLNHFTNEQLETLKKEHEKHRQENQEFEVYKIGMNSEPKSPGLKADCQQEGQAHNDHGEPAKKGQADYNEGERARTSLATDCREVAVHHGAHDGTVRGAADDPSKAPAVKDVAISGDPIQRLRPQSSDEWNTIRDRRVSGELERRGRPPADARSARLGGSRSTRSRSPSSGRSTTRMSPPTRSSIVANTEAGTQLPPAVLGMPGASGTPMRVLRMGELSTVVEDMEHYDLDDKFQDDHRTEHEEQGVTHTNNSDQREPSTEDPDPNSVGESNVRARGHELPTSSDDLTGDEQSRQEGEVQGLRHNHQGGLDPPEEEQGDDPYTNRTRAISDDRTIGKRNETFIVEGVNGVGDGGGVRGLPTVEEDAREVNENSHEWSRQVERTYRQSVAAVERAQECLSEIMNLLKEKDPAQEGWDRIHQQQSGAQCMRPLKRYGEILRVDHKGLKKVAELYNPNRFGDTALKKGLLKGAAFDLQLGTDLLGRPERERVLDYFMKTKPGLTIISPPCTMFSRLQQLSRHKHEDREQLRNYLKKLRDARTLLRFGVDVALTILHLGGSFVFEHPLTSTAWGEQEVQKLIHHDGVQMYKGDQCMYGLQDSNGKRYKKPTGWLTNVAEIGEKLSMKCDRRHEHEHVIGHNDAGNRSTQAQHYPKAIVESILRGYKQFIQHKEDIVHVGYQEIIDQIDTEERRERQLRHEVHAMDGTENEAAPAGDEPQSDQEENPGLPDELPDLEQQLRRLPRARWSIW